MNTAEALVNAKKQAIVRVNDFYSKTIESLIGSPSQTEKDTWSLKLKIANDIAHSRLLSKESLSYLNALEIDTPEELTYFANTIISKAIIYSAVVGIADKLRSEAKESISNALDADTIEETLIKLEKGAIAAITKLKNTPPNTAPMKIVINNSILSMVGHDGISETMANSSILIPDIFKNKEVEATVSNMVMATPSVVELEKVIYKPNLEKEEVKSPIADMIINDDSLLVVPTVELKNNIKLPVIKGQ